MDTTVKALEAIRTEWLAQDAPPISQVAKRANMPAITARRYLDGSTKHGDPAKVRALAIALGRMDIAETVRDTVSAELSDQIMEYMAEKFLLWRESNLEEVDRERAAREVSEKRYAAEIERIITSKDKSIDLLNARISKLEKDKETLVDDKAVLMVELEHARKGKRKYEKIVVGLFVLLALYFIIFDLPYPDYGVTEVLLDIFHK